ncbi:MAG: hypothetical protein Q8O67_32655 [Deltaproteobacteria bacterium]|nr:hypothetical protein [Deltaproteobacteria bacterium]
MNALPDQFELLDRLARQNRLFVFFGAVGMLIGVLGIYTTFVVGMQPTPVVVWPDNPYAPARLVKTGEVQVREVDAKRFFLLAADRLLGWNSAEVKGSFDEVSLMMNREWREQFRSSLEHIVAVPQEVHPSGKLTNLTWMIASRVRNEVEPIALEDITCTRTDVQWNCKAVVKVRAQPLLGAPSDDPALRRRVLVQAGFKEYPVTNAALYGLLIAYWEVLDKDLE